MPKLQIALDFTSVDKALTMAKKVADYCDILEAGTPLIKAEGARVIKILKENFPDKLIFADMKTVDVGGLEVELAGKSGADYISVLAVSSDNTIKSSLETARRFNSQIVFDLMGAYDKVRRAKELEKLGAKYIHVHTGLDEQKEGKNPFWELSEISKNTSVQLTVAGGINISSIERILAIPNVEIIMVGQAITNSQNPKEEAKLLYEKVHGR